jgi:Flp pilus assembly protein TadD
MLLNSLSTRRGSLHVLANLKKYQEAFLCFDNATKIDSMDAAAWRDKGLALDKLGRKNESKVALDKAKELGFAG